MKEDYQEVGRSERQRLILEQVHYNGEEEEEDDDGHAHFSFSPIFFPRILENEVWSKRLFLFLFLLLLLIVLEIYKAASLWATQ